MEPKFVICDNALCIGCQLCESACSAVKEKSFNPHFSRIHVVHSRQPPSSMAIACCLCEDHPCVKACPKKALSVNEKTGVVQIDSDICVACGWCIASCEWGALSLHPITNSAIVCDLCNGDPECVKLCPKEALSFSTMNDAVQKTQTEASKKLIMDIYRSSRADKKKS